jgi:HK97 family phage major capsid protein
VTFEEMIGHLTEGRDAVVAQQEALMATAQAESRTALSPAEQASWEQLATEAEDLNTRITELTEAEGRRRVADTAARDIAAGNTRVQVISEERTYRGPDGPSYFRDLALANSRNDPDSLERLARHGREAEVDGRQSRDISRTDAAGGTFVPPLWLIDMYAPFLRAGRTAANLVRSMDLPPGTDSINLPTITTGSGTAIQTADNAAVQETDLVTSSVAAPVVTIAGQEDAAVQLIDQSPLAGGLDQLIFADLLADYNQKLDAQVINGSGSAGQAKGMLNATGINSITYTQASPTQATHYPVFAQMLSKIAGSRFAGATAILMRPDRWYWFQSALDSTNRPFYLAGSQGPFNAAGLVENPGQAEGLAGVVLGLPVYIDANIPNNLGGGTNEDRIIAARWDDSILFEGALRTQVNPYVLSGNLTVRFTLWRYAAFTAERLPKSIATTTGTGNIVTTVLSGF